MSFRIQGKLVWQSRPAAEGQAAAGPQEDVRAGRVMGHARAISWT